MLNRQSDTWNEVNYSTIVLYAIVFTHWRARVYPWPTMKIKLKYYIARESCLQLKYNFEKNVKHARVKRKYEIFIWKCCCKNNIKTDTDSFYLHVSSSVTNFLRACSFLLNVNRWMPVNTINVIDDCCGLVSMVVTIIRAVG